MPTGTILPLPKLQLFTDDGEVAAGYQLFSYEAGTTTKLDTYSDVNLTVPNTNPIILDSAGRATVFLSDDSYKFVFTDDTDTDPPTSPIWTVDGVHGASTSNANIDISGTAGETLAAYETAYLSDGSGGLTAGRWYLTNSDHNYSSVDAPSLGMVQTGGAAGAAVVIRTNGRSTASGTLSAGTTYYLSSTPGALDSSSTQQNRCPFGQADTTSTIIFPIEGTISISIKNALATFGYASGQGNDATTDDIELTSYAVTVPDNFLNGPGDAIVMEGTFVKAANTHVVTVKLSIGSSGLLTVFTNNQNVANHRIPFRFNVIRRTSIQAAVTGLFYHGAAHTGAPTVYLANHLVDGTIDWTTAQALKLYVATDTVSSANDIFLTDLFIYQTRSPYGTLV